MKIIQTDLDGVVTIEPELFKDGRGWFMETYSHRRYSEYGIVESFVQDNISFSQKGVLRGLHFQYPQPQGKLIQVLSGEVMDVVVDIRVGSPTYGQWLGEILSEANHRQMYVPPGLAHGYYTTSETALFSYKCSDFYNPATEHGIIWNDPDIGIEWPTAEPVLSPKDGVYPVLKDLRPENMPQFEGN